MAEATVLYEVADGIATITFNRPEAMNALLPEMSDQLVALVDRAEADDAVRVMVLTGAGKAFCAGGDIKLMARPDRIGRTALVGRERVLHAAHSVERLLRRDKPLIAAVNGAVAGAACGYALACDFIVASETARFLFSFVRIGFAPDGGTTYLLTRRVGLANAQRIVLTAEPVSAAEALRLGLVTEVVPADALRDRVRALAGTIASHSPSAIRLSRGLLDRAVSADFRQATEAEALAQGILGETEDHKEAVRAFVEKRKPTFTGK